MKKKVKDERVEHSKLEAYKEVLYVVAIILVISLFKKALIIKQGLESYAGEFICLGTIVLYIVLRNLWLGNLVRISETVNKKVVFLSTILSSLSVTLIFAINNYNTYSDKYSGIFDGLFWASILIIFIQHFIICGIGFYFLGKKAIKDRNLED
ncbi:DUF6773 family protein [Streptococcus phocae]|uniref:Uncharacterized protein n=1 Tax=Streptococcus phocae TaxID=119224 RepID=A0A0P6S2E3_9STRE|nr:DUF6773 family protein [Streptococcus phocae]KPJ22714.1 hypothetical protein AKK44_03450 [Streptococcus phocae]